MLSVWETLQTDHGALSRFKNFKNPEGQLARWLEVLSEYDFKIEHRRGRSHLNADALSRRPCPVECKHCGKVEQKDEECKSLTVEKQNYQLEKPICAVDNELDTVDESVTHNEEVCDEERHVLDLLNNGILSVEILRTEQLKDPDLQKIIDFKEAGERPEWSAISHLSTTFKYYWARWDVLHLRSGVLYRKWETFDGTKFDWQLVLPKSFRHFVFQQLHETPTSGHLGITKTLSKIRSRFFWYAMRNDVTHWCQTCDKCASRKRTPRHIRAPLQSYNVGAPLERVAIDVLGPLPTSDNGNKYLLVIGDYFTKWMDAYPMPNQESTTVAEILVKNFVVVFGVSKNLTF